MSVDATMMDIAAPSRRALSLDAVPAPRRDAFLRARKHSRTVRTLKLVLPVTGLVVAALFAFFTLGVSSADVSIAAAGTAVSNGQLVMADPKLEGFSKDGRAYWVNATRAIQAMDDVSRIHLEKIAARLPVNKSDWISVEAPGGIYDRDKNLLHIAGGADDAIKVVSSDGTTVDMRSAVLDMETGTLRSTEVVDIKQNGGNVTAKSLEVTKDGKILVFEDRVRMTLEPRKLQNSSNGDGNAQP